MHSKIDKAGLQLPSFSDLSQSEHLQVGTEIASEEKPATPPPPPIMPFLLNWPFALEHWEPWCDLDTDDVGHQI